MHTLLIVDDEKATRDGLRMALSERFDCYIAADTAQAIELLKSEPIDLLLTDLRLGGDSGMDLLEQIHHLPRPPLTIMMTAYGSVDAAVEAMRRGAWNFITKPLNLEAVELLLLRAAQEHDLLKENSLLKQEVQDLQQQTSSPPKGLNRMIGHSPVMLKLSQRIQQVASTKATVLIEGESGTGKEVIAHAIHDLSSRSSHPMVIVNCAALSPQLLESELFGHEKGAFTGATQRRIGRFEEAHQGTLFLDEIGEIDPSIQVKLLRALSERTIERVGSNTSINVDVRLITATNKNLLELIEQKQFRDDLYFRLNVVNIVSPPLRERGQDILLLANQFLKEFSLENQKQLNLSASTKSLLQSYEWPGNVRELRTAIEHGVIMSQTDTLTPSDLPSSLHSPPASLPSSSFSSHSVETTPQFHLQTIEQRTIQNALDFTQGNRTKAAELLGISRRTLQRKLNQL